MTTERDGDTRSWTAAVALFAAAAAVLLLAGWIYSVAFDPYRGLVAAECWPYRDYEICQMVTPTP